MSRSLRIVHAPVPSPVLRWSAWLTKPASDAEVTGALADWNASAVFHQLPADWPGDDPTLSQSPPAGMTVLRGQGTYTGVDPNLIVMPRVVNAVGAMLIWQALWLFDASAAPLSGQCPSPVCPPCPVVPPAPPAAGGGGMGWGLAILIGGGAAAAGYAAGRVGRR